MNGRGYPIQGTLFLLDEPVAAGPYAHRPPDPRLSRNAQRLLDVLGVGPDQAQHSQALARHLGLADEARGVRDLADELLRAGYPVFAEMFHGIYLIPTAAMRARAIALYRQGILLTEMRIALLQEAEVAHAD